MKASGVKPQRVEWLWHPYIPAGKITAVAGQMGQGKSLFTCWLAAAVTTGELGPPRSVVMYSAEDDPEDTIVPRLAAAGADLERIWLEPDAALDAGRIATICDDFEDVALITVDPVQAYLPAGVNAWKGQDIRRHLDPIRRLAAERALTIALTQHLNRRSDAGDPLARIADSQGIPQLARSVLLWGPDPADPAGDQGSSKALTRAKGNLSRSPASATFTISEKAIGDGIKAPVLLRGSDREITPDDVLADSESRSATEEATKWLRVQLADGPLAAKEVMDRARRDGLAERTMRRAKARAGAVSEQARDDGAIRGWVWRLRDPINPLGHVGHVGHLGRVGQEGQGGQGGQDGQRNTDIHLPASDGQRDEAEIERLIAVAEETDREAASLGLAAYDDEKAA